MHIKFHSEKIFVVKSQICVGWSRNGNFWLIVMENLLCVLKDFWIDTENFLWIIKEGIWMKMRVIKDSSEILETSLVLGRHVYFSKMEDNT